MLCEGFLQLRKWRLLSGYGVPASCSGGFRCCRSQALGTWASAVVAQGSSYSTACGIFPDQGSNRVPWTRRLILICYTSFSTIHYIHYVLCHYTAAREVLLELEFNPGLKHFRNDFHYSKKIIIRLDGIC